LRSLAVVISLISVVLILGACGDDDGGGNGGVELDGTTLTRNLEATGYTVEEADEQGLPATVGSFAISPDSGFEQGYTVTGKGLDQPDPTRVENVVTVLLYDGSDNAENAFDDLGGETDNRKLAGNGIYMYGGGVTGTPSPQVQQVIDAAQG
jgi:hypothetical protein